MRPVYRRGQIAGAMLLALVILLPGVLPAASAASAFPACFGAQAWDTDPAHRCQNPALRLAVIPTPDEAAITPSAPCNVLDARLNSCAFGVSTAPTGTFALVGDSHAGQWRAALDVVARALGWAGISLTRPSCPFTLATTALPEPLRSQCSRWTQDVIRWFSQHPEQSTIFVSAHSGAAVIAPGQQQLAARAGGYASVWAALPSSVKHIVVIRDNPSVRTDTLPCVQNAILRRVQAGLACAVRRSVALPEDPEVDAAGKVASARIQVMDMTHFFCDSRLCYPVIGGALVYRDINHLTRVYASTLGPFLTHRFGRLLASWRTQDKSPTSYQVGQAAK